MHSRPKSTPSLREEAIVEEASEKEELSPLEQELQMENEIRLEMVIAYLNYCVVVVLVSGVFEHSRPATLRELNKQMLTFQVEL